MNLPIDYCRFVLPDGRGFSINEDVTSDNPILGMYHFNPNRRMKLGVCSIIVNHASKEHSGTWTCAGKLIGRDEESGDDFTVYVQGNNLIYNKTLQV